MNSSKTAFRVKKSILHVWDSTPVREEEGREIRAEAQRNVMY